MEILAAPAPMPKRTPWEVQRAVLIALFQRELKARFNGRWIRVFWVFLEPLAHLVFMTLIMTYVRHRIVPGMPIPLFLITGVVPFVLFRNISVRVMGSAEANRALFGYRQVQPIDPLIARVGVECVLQSVIYVVFLAALGWLGMPWLPSRPLELIGVSAVLVLLGLGLGLILMVGTEGIPQLRTLVRIAFMPLYLISGVIFHVRNLPSETIDKLAWNPLLHLIDLSRGYFAPQYPVIPQATLAYPAVTALVLLFIGLSMYRNKRQQLLG